jgi:hypothetical protein
MTDEFHDLRTLRFFAPNPPIHFGVDFFFGDQSRTAEQQNGKDENATLHHTIPSSWSPGNCVPGAEKPKLYMTPSRRALAMLA